MKIRQFSANLKPNCKLDMIDQTSNFIQFLDSCFGKIPTFVETWNEGSNKCHPPKTEVKQMDMI
jgi:hypothetical protein